MPSMDPSFLRVKEVNLCELGLPVLRVVKTRSYEPQFRKHGRMYTPSRPFANSLSTFTPIEVNDRAELYDRIFDRKVLLSFVSPAINSSTPGVVRIGGRLTSPC